MSTKRSRPVILVVDDTPENIDVLNGILQVDYEVRAALSANTALQLAQRLQPDLILLDVLMPEIDGYETCRRLKRDVATRSIPVIFVTALSDHNEEAKGFEAGGVDYVCKPISPMVVRARVRTHLALANQTRELELQVHQRTAELRETRLQIVYQLGRAAEFKDNETGLHVIRMGHYARLLALAIGMSEADADLIFHAAPMHDIGKLGIPDHILQKPGRLTDEEWQLMKMHPIYGARILGEEDESPLFQLARSIALTHHERWDGTGYPFGLRETDIPLEGRIAAVADVFDALTSDRPYKKAWSVEEATAHLLQQRGTHFDPALVDRFVSIMPDIIRIKEKYAESHEHWAQKQRYHQAIAIPTIQLPEFSPTTNVPSSSH